MVIIEEVQVDIEVTSTGIGIVTMHPYLNDCLTDVEPFKWKDQKKEGQLAKLERALAVSQSNRHGLEKTHFTIIPEYGLPGIGGVQVVDQYVKDHSPRGSMVMAGIDGLSRDEYSAICEMEGVSVHAANSAESVTEGHWVNACMIWEKPLTEGVPVRRWVQPKLCQSWPEENIAQDYMFEGKCLYLFKARTDGNRAFRILCMICFDWIGRIDNNNGIRSVLDKLNQPHGGTGDPKQLDFIVVIQNNKKPNHQEFLTSAKDFYTLPGYQLVERHNAVILMANAAGHEKPCSCACGTHGNSSFIFGPSAPYQLTASAPPSYAVLTQRFNREALGQCKNALFRESGECVHSGRLFHPLFLNPVASDRRLPLQPLVVSPLTANGDDRRLPDAQVPSAVKWINDLLDNHMPITGHGAIAATIGTSSQSIVGLLRNDTHDHIVWSIVTAGFPNGTNDQKISDSWDQPQVTAATIIVTSVTILNCSQTMIIQGALAHAYYVDDRGSVVDVVIVCGCRSHNENIRRARERCPGSISRKQLVVSMDLGDTPMTDRDRDITEDDVSVTYCGYHNLKGVLAASSVEELQGSISACIGVLNG